MRILIILIFLMSSSFANETKDIKNVFINKELKKYDGLTFLDVKNEELNLSDFKGNLILLNFWATWCAPCKEEMPSLDKFNAKNPDFLVYPINLEKINQKKTKKFYDDLNIQNLKIFFDPEFQLAKQFKLRGVPTTIFINQKGQEFARVIGDVDFSDKNFIKWLNDFY